MSSRATSTEELPPPISLRRAAWLRLRRHKVAWWSLWFLIFFTFTALFTPLLPLQSPRQINLEKKFQPPDLQPAPPLFAQLKSNKENQDHSSKEKQDDFIETRFGKLGTLSHLLVRARLAIFKDWSIPSLCGTDNQGRDLLSRIFWGARISILVGIVATLVSLVIGVSYGAIAGYLGGWIDNLMMRLVDVGFSIPFIFVVIFLISILDAEGLQGMLQAIGFAKESLGPGTFWGEVTASLRIYVFFFVIGAIFWLTMARVVRGQVISLKTEPFVEAAIALGATRKQIILRHIAPNLASIVIVYLTLTIPRVMLFEAFLSFLGFGVEPPDVSWGLLANDGMLAICKLNILWWLVVFPGIALGVTLWALNFLGDGLRDALDPKLRNK